MKRLFFALTAVAALSLASCTKDRTCTCTTTETFMGQTETSTESYVINDSRKSDARERCLGISSTDGSYKEECELK